MNQPKITVRNDFLGKGKNGIVWQIFLFFQVRLRIIPFANSKKKNISKNLFVENSEQKFTKNKIIN